MANRFEIIVIGADEIGSATAYHLAQAGQPMVHLRPFCLAQQRASSQGDSQLISYNADTLHHTSIIPDVFATVMPAETPRGASTLSANQRTILGFRAAAPLRSDRICVGNSQLPLPAPNKNASTAVFSPLSPARPLAGSRAAVFADSGRRALGQAVGQPDNSADGPQGSVQSYYEPTTANYTR